MGNRKENLLYLLTLLLSGLFIFFGWLYVQDGADLFQNKNDPSMESVLCQVQKITDDDQKISSMGSMYYLERTIAFDGLVLSGPRKGQVLPVIQMIDNVSTIGLKAVSVGDKVFAYSNTENGEITWNAGDYYRSGKLLGLGVFFCLGLLFFGQRKGFNTIVSLGFTCLAIFVVFLPSILSGHDPYISSLVICLYIIAITLCLVSGYSLKSLASALGCAGGVLAAGLLTVFMGAFMKLTGFLDDDSMYVYLLNPDSPIDLKAIIFAANIIGALGATMDVSMSISSSLHELVKKVPDIQFKAIFAAGLEIGRDIMGTMANTLVLAYIGSSLSTVLLFISYQSSLLQLLNRELIVVELLQALTGSIGILLTIPISAFVASALYPRRVVSAAKE